LKKRTKKLLRRGVRRFESAALREKVFCFFFSKKKTFLASSKGISP